MFLLSLPRTINMKKWIIILILLIEVPAKIYAQQKLKGTILNDDGSPIANASISCKLMGTLSDNNGHFVLKISKDCNSISIKAVGYISKTITIASFDTILVVLQKVQQELYEVVVVSGYGKRGIKGKISSTKNSGLINDKPSENKFIVTTCEPVSTFGVDVDKASYSHLRRQINENEHVDANNIKIEEMINYFDYDYLPSTNANPYSLYSEITTCPWNQTHEILKIAFKGKIESHENYTPAHFVFLIDVSGSMNGADRLDLVKESFKLLLDSLNKEDLISIVTYAGKAGIALEATSVENKRQIFSVIDNLVSGGKTAGSKGINTAYDLAEKYFIEDGNNRIILATDGDFNVGVTNYKALEKLITEKKKTGIYLTGLGFGTGNYKDEVMEILADKGNGNYYYIDNLAEAKRVLQKDFKGTINTIAKDVKLQVEFNGIIVSGYRLIGYENRLLNKEDFKDDNKDAGEIGEGHVVTVLYEIIRANAATNDNMLDTAKCSKLLSNVGANILATLKTRYKLPDSNKSVKLDHILPTNTIAFEQATHNTKWAIIVAMLGMYLKDSPYLENVEFSEILELAKLNIDYKNEKEVEFNQLLDKLKTQD